MYIQIIYGSITSERTLVTPIPTHSRDTPPHFDSDSTFEVTNLKSNEKLEVVEGPIDDILESAEIVNFETRELPRLFSPHHCKQSDAKSRIKEAIKLVHDYLCRPILQQSFELTCSNYRQPLFVEALKAMEETVQELRIIGVDGKIIGAAPRLLGIWLSITLFTSTLTSKFIKNIFIISRQ